MNLVDKVKSDYEEIAVAGKEFDQISSYLKSIASRIKLQDGESYYITRNGKYLVGNKVLENLDDVVKFIDANKKNSEILRLNMKLILETDWGNNPLPDEIVDQLTAQD